MLDENKYPTLKYYRCKKCGHVFSGSLSGENDCPECRALDTTQFLPGDDDLDTTTDQNS